MQNSVLLHRAALVFIGVMSFAGDGNSAPSLPSTLTPKTVAAWERTGASFGYTRPGPYSDKPEFAKDTCGADKKGLPTFEIPWPIVAQLATLPNPEVPFRLVVTHGLRYLNKQDDPIKTPPRAPTSIDLSYLTNLRQIRVDWSETPNCTALFNGLLEAKQLENIDFYDPPESILKRLDELPVRHGIKGFRLHVHVGDDTLRLVSRAKGLTSLTISGQFTATGLNHLQALKALEELDAGRWDPISDAELAAIGNIGTLKRLAIVGTSKITDEGLSHLSRLSSLASLSLKQCDGITGAKWLGIEKLRNLRELYLHECKHWCDAGVAAISKLGGLRELSLFGCSAVTDEGLTFVSSLRELRGLYLGFNANLSIKGLRVVGQLSNLERLYIQFCTKVTNGDLSQIAGLNKLQSLMIAGCKSLTDDGVNVIVKLPAMRELRASWIDGLTVKSLDTITAVKDLERLELEGCANFDLTDSDIKSLARLTRLKRLHLPPTPKVTPEGYSALRALRNLDELSLSSSPLLNDVVINEWSHLPVLRRLNLFNSPNVTDASLRNLSRMDSLRTLDCRKSTKITAEGVLAFRQ